MDFGGLDNRLLSLTTDVLRIGDGIDAMNLKLEAMNAKIGQMDGKIDRLDGRVANIEGKLDISTAFEPN